MSQEYESEQRYESRRAHSLQGVGPAFNLRITAEENAESEYRESLNESAQQQAEDSGMTIEEFIHSNK